MRNTGPSLEPVLNIHKMKTYLSLSECAGKKYGKSQEVHGIVCPRCNTCVGQTSQHLLTWLSENKYKCNQLVLANFDNCIQSFPTVNNVGILMSGSLGVDFF